MPKRRMGGGLRVASALIMSICLAGLGCMGGTEWVPVQAHYQTAANNNQANDSGVRQANYQPGYAPTQAGPGYAPPPPPGPGPGCLNCPGGGSPMGQGQGGGPLPTELQKVSLPPYMVEPPDILLIDAARLVPKPPYRIEPLDNLIIQATETFPNQPIGGIYTVSPDGYLALGFNYGSLRAVGLTLEQLEQQIRLQLGKVLRNPGVTVGLAQFRGLLQIRGQHLVRPDGTISLGIYGCVHVAGLTLAQVKTVVERHLSMYLDNPEVAVDVFAYNSKAYYVITDGAGYGQNVYKFPITGNETVLDAIQAIQGLPAVASKRAIWVARPTPCDHPCNQILPVDWLAIVQGGSTCTNYQLFPGDRIYVKADPLVCLDYGLAKILNPINRIFGTVLLGTSIYESIAISKNGGAGGAFFVR